MIDKVLVLPLPYMERALLRRVGILPASFFVFPADDQNVLAHPHHGRMGAGLKVCFHPDIEAFFIFRELVELPVTERAEAFEPHHLQDLDAGLGEIGLEFLG